MALLGIAGNDGRDSIAIDGHAHAASVVIDQYRERSQLTGLIVWVCPESIRPTEVFSRTGSSVSRICRSPCHVEVPGGICRKTIRLRSPSAAMVSSSQPASCSLYLSNSAFPGRADSPCQTKINLTKISILPANSKTVIDCYHFRIFRERQRGVKRRRYRRGRMKRSLPNSRHPPRTDRVRAD